MYEDTDYGRDIVPYLDDAFEGINTNIPYRSVIPVSASEERIAEELSKLMMMQTRVFVVHMSGPVGSLLFSKAREIGMMSEGYVWIMTDGLTGIVDSLDPSIINSMQGALGVKVYIPLSNTIDNFALRWQRRFQQENPDDPPTDVSVHGRWAYDTVWALAMAIEKAGAVNSTFTKSAIVGNATEFERLGVSEVGPRLLHAILHTRFTGVSGEFRIVDGQIQDTMYQIINVVGRGGRGIGFWTSDRGISRKFESSGSSKGLNPVIWPGESDIVPSGWEIPTSGKKLKIGVPVKDGFSEFVKVIKDPVTNLTLSVTGYCIDVFEAVVQKLPYALPHEYEPFENSTGQMAGTYNDLVYQVYLKKYDAVIGDTTIRANRSLYVDFTLPYTESGVAMIVPVKDTVHKNAWIFIKPLTTDLWLGSLVFFFFTGTVVWVMEHRINDDFRGPISRQLGTIFYFSFSTIVFAHRERVEHILSRVVVVIWFFVMLILTSSYTASLTALLTVQQLQPTVTTLQELQERGDYLGYPKDSFVEDILKQLKFDEAKIMGYGLEQYFEALSKGSKNGGVAAIVDEIPYIKLFLTKYCTGYTMIGPIFQSAGFGFVFPKGSPLINDISERILKEIEGDDIVAIKMKWLGDPNACLNQDTLVTSNSLNFRSFWGLFLITGAASTCSLFIYLSIFFYKHWHELRNINPNKTIWRRIPGWIRYYNTKDHSFHTFRKEKSIDEDGDSIKNNDIADIELQHPSSTPNLSDVGEEENTSTEEESQGSPNS